MGEYRCPIAKTFRPAKHRGHEWHWDGQSSICPVLRDAIEEAAGTDDMPRLVKLVELMKKHFGESL